MKTINYTTNYTYRKPLNFDPTRKEFEIFNNVLTENCVEPKVILVKNVRIATNSVVFKYFKIFKESCVADVYKQYHKGFSFFFKFIFPKLNFSKKRFLLITDDWTSNYYHWHICALKKLLILKEKNLIKGSKLFLPIKYRSYKFVLPSLKKFGIEESQIVFLRRKSNIKVAETILFEDAGHHPIIFREIQKILVDNTKKIDLGFGSRIYISREKQALRYVENEKEVVELLEKYGFKKVVMEHFSYDEQISICSQIKYLVGPHGAGLTNLFFVPSDASLLEMTTPPNKLKPVTDYYQLSNLLDLKYLIQECQMGPNSKVQDFHQCSLLVDLTTLEQNLKFMLSH